MTERELVERLGLYAEELIEPHDGDIGGARVRAAKAMREAATLLERLSSSEVTEEMLDAAERVPIMCGTYGIARDDARAIYLAMRSAATSERKG